MRLKRLTLYFVVLLLVVPVATRAQQWSGILDPSRAINWSNAGIPGGIPSAIWTQASTITAVQCGNGSSDCTSVIQKALNACGTNQYVLIGPGTFLLNGGLSIPSNCALRGSGADQTILNAKGTNVQDVLMGSFLNLNWANAVPITGGSSQGSTSITLSSASGISVGMYLIIDQVNDGTVVSQNGSEGQCTWCDGQTSDGSRAQGQIVKVGSVSGNTVTISPGLFDNYTRSPLAMAFNAAAKYAGLENLQIYANNSHQSNPTTIEMDFCAYCWISGVEGNYTDGDHVDIHWSYGVEIVNSYFFGTYGTGPGQFDHGIRLGLKTTYSLVQNNILQRTGILEPEWGPAGNVISYNYMFGNFSSTAPNFLPGDIETHGAHPQYNLYEGNIVPKIDFENIWGSVANETVFRNWVTGANVACNPINGTRGIVVCTPLGAYGNSGISGWWQIQAVWALNGMFLSTSLNYVGDVVGSAAMQSLTQYNGGTPMGQTPILAWSTTAIRSYDVAVYGMTFGFGEASDSGAGGSLNGAGCSPPTLPYPCHSTKPYSTVLIHGLYNNVDGSTIWATGLSQKLPASFYLPSRPSWWSTPWATPAWPPIGPDVTGGIDAGGHAALNPAALCYKNSGMNSDGSISFDAASCYGNTNSLPAPPTNLTLTIN
jgi:Pectate lyase superfamily protein